MPFNFFHARVSNHFILLQLTLSHFKTINIKFLFYELEKRHFFSVSIRMLNLALNKLRLIATRIDSYYSMSRNQLINLILPTLKPAFKIKKVIDK